MQVVFVALAFLLLVASPAIMAALPVRDEEHDSKGLADAVPLGIPAHLRSR